MVKKLIKIKTKEEFQDLLSQGYKVVNSYTRFGMSRDEKSEINSDCNFGYLFLEKEDSKITVDCSELGLLFASQYTQFADVDRTYFDKISDHTEKSDIEWYTYDYFNQRRKPCLHIEKINSKNTEKIILFLKAHVKNEMESYSKNNLGKNLFNIFSHVLLINENNDKIDCDVLDKNELTIQKINQLRKNAKTKQNSFVFSFFNFYSKSSKSKFHPDFFIGCIFYDLKNQKTISFNLTSMYEEGENNNFKGGVMFAHCCNQAFEKSFQKESFLSMLHVSILHTTYTPIPWLFFAIIYPINEILQDSENEDYFINISEFFVFGISKELNTQESFYYDNITKVRKGRAVIQLDLFKDKKINYQLRFDVSKEEKFLHVDFGYYQNTSMIKLLSHYPIDMKMVKNFSKRLFVSIMSSGFYDPKFAEILKYKLKNTPEIVRKYKELSEPLKIIHNSGETAQWIKDNGLLEEFQKIYFNSKDIDMKKYYQISNKNSGLFSKNEKGKIHFTYNGLMVLVRLMSEDDPKLQLIKNYLSKSNYP